MTAVAAVALVTLTAGCTADAPGGQGTSGSAGSGTGMSTAASPGTSTLADPGTSAMTTPAATGAADNSGAPGGQLKGRAVAVWLVAETVQDVQQLHADVAGLAQGGLPPDTFTTAAGEVAQQLRARAETLRRIKTGAATGGQHRVVEQIAAQLRAYADIAGEVAKLRGTDVPAALIHRLRKVDHSWTSAMSGLARMTHTQLLNGLPPFHYPDSVPSPPK